MTSIYISNIISFEAMVLGFAFATQSFPGSWYKSKLSLIQLILMSIAFFTGIYAFVVSGKLADEISSLNSAYHQDAMGIFLFLYATFFFGSIYKYYRYRLSVRDGLLAVFELSGNEYRVEKEFHLMLDEKFYMANVKAYIKYQDSIIMLAGSVPEAGGRLKLYCNKIKDNLYDCYAFTELDKKFSLRKAFFAFVTFCVFLSAMYLPFLFVRVDIVNINGGNPADYSNLFGAIALLIFGVTASRIIKGSKGFIAKLLYVFCIFLALISLLYFYRSAKLLLGIF